MKPVVLDKLRVVRVARDGFGNKTFYDLRKQGRRILIWLNLNVLAVANNVTALPEQIKKWNMSFARSVCKPCSVTAKVEVLSISSSISEILATGANAK